MEKAGFPSKPSKPFIACWASLRRRIRRGGRSLSDIVHACSALGGACAYTGTIFAMHRVSRLLWGAVCFGVAADALARSQAFVAKAARAP